MSRTITLVACAAAAVAVAAGTAAATSPGSPTDVTFVPVPGHVVFSNRFVSAHGTVSPVMIGGSTTVPSDATAVQFTVRVKGSAPGTLSIYPAGNPAGGSGDSVHWTTTKGASASIAETIGSSDEITFASNSTQAINLSVTIIGYSTQVSAGDVNSSGGNPGQVLTDTGDGAAWQTPGTVYVDHAVATTLQTEANTAGGFTNLIDGVPAGSYVVHFTASVHRFSNGSDALVTCRLRSSAADADVVEADTSVDGGTPDASVALQAVATLSTTGFFGVRCTANQLAQMVDQTLTAMPVGTVIGVGS
jgi:hypothetical protein